MVPGMSQPDVLLEVVLVLSAAAAEPLVSDYIRPQTYLDHSSSYVYTCLFHQACEVIASSNVLGLAYQLLKDRLAGGAEARKTQDVEMVLQLLFLFYRCDNVTVFMDLYTCTCVDIVCLCGQAAAARAESRGAHVQHQTDRRRAGLPLAPTSCREEARRTDGHAV